ncbi:30S ribosomal protein S3 [Candidatus Babeliales bacterium]|nr:30S ribosomal protein S3 [Candidatus Babeliales bacterium]
MGQKVHPFGFRLGVFEDWKAQWFAKKNYGAELAEDLGIRKFLDKELSNSEVSKLVIQKAGNSIRVVIHSSRPGVIIGKKGVGIEKIRAELLARFKKNIDISVQEVRNPDIDAQIVADGISEQLVKRAHFKKLMKKAGSSAMKSGAKGIKICCGGRLGGAEIARKEWLRLGCVPLHTLRSNVDFATSEAKTTYGIVGVKVWICKGEY